MIKSDNTLHSFSPHSHFFLSLKLRVHVSKDGIIKLEEAEEKPTYM